jgi:hypothetical protein
VTVCHHGRAYIYEEQGIRRWKRSGMENQQIVIVDIQPHKPDELSIQSVSTNDYIIAG